MSESVFEQHGGLPVSPADPDRDTWDDAADRAEELVKLLDQP